MAEYTFRLKTVLSLRQAEREQRRAELHAALDDERQLAEQRQGIDAELDRHLRWKSAGAAPGPLDLEKLKSAGQYEAALRAQLAALAETHRAASAETGRCRDALAAADGEVRVLEKLRERQQTSFLAEQARREARHGGEPAGR